MPAYETKGADDRADDRANDNDPVAQLGKSFEAHHQEVKMIAADLKRANDRLDDIEKKANRRRAFGSGNSSVVGLSQESRPRRSWPCR